MGKDLLKGHVSRQELIAAYNLHRSTKINVFRVMDADSDGRLTPAEISARAPKMMEAFAYLDQGKKGYLSQADFFPANALLSFTASARKRSTTEILTAPAESSLGDALGSSVTNGATVVPLDGVEDGIESRANALEDMMTFAQLMALPDEARAAYLHPSRRKTSCGGTNQPPCEIDVIIVTDSRLNLASESFYGGGGGFQHVSFDAVISYDLLEAAPVPDFQKDKRLCIQAGEVCSPWGTRAQGICAEIYAEGPGRLNCIGDIELEKFDNCPTIRTKNPC